MTLPTGQPTSPSYRASTSHFARPAVPASTASTPKKKGITGKTLSAVAAASLAVGALAGGGYYSLGVYPHKQLLESYNQSVSNVSRAASTLNDLLTEADTAGGLCHRADNQDLCAELGSVVSGATAPEYTPELASPVTASNEDSNEELQAAIDANNVQISKIRTYGNHVATMTQAVLLSEEITAVTESMEAMDTKRAEAETQRDRSVSLMGDGGDEIVAVTEAVDGAKKQGATNQEAIDIARELVAKYNADALVAAGDDPAVVYQAQWNLLGETDWEPGTLDSAKGEEEKPQGNVEDIVINDSFEHSVDNLAAAKDATTSFINELQTTAGGVRKARIAWIGEHRGSVRETAAANIKSYLETESAAQGMNLATWPAGAANEWEQCIIDGVMTSFSDAGLDKALDSSFGAETTVPAADAEAFKGIISSCGERINAKY